MDSESVLTGFHGDRAVRGVPAPPDECVGHRAAAEKDSVAVTHRVETRAARDDRIATE